MNKYNFTQKEIEEIRANLYLADEEYNELWQEWEDATLTTLWEYKDMINQKDVAYCLESDFWRDEDYNDELNIKLEVLIKDKGIIIYKKIKNKASFSNEVLDVKDYVEEITGNRPDYTTLAEMEKDFEENDVCLWNYPICEADYIVEEKLKVCLVRFKTLYGGYEYRWCEME